MAATVTRREPFRPRPTWRASSERSGSVRKRLELRLDQRLGKFFRLQHSQAMAVRRRFDGAGLQRAPAARRFVGLRQNRNDFMR